jgi:hypothetical protein
MTTTAPTADQADLLVAELAKKGSVAEIVYQLAGQ